MVAVSRTTITVPAELVAAIGTDAADQRAWLARMRAACRHATLHGFSWDDEAEREFWTREEGSG